MQKKNVDEILRKQRAFFQSGATLPLEFRKNALKRLYDTVLAYEERIYQALRADLGKSDTESYMCEVGMALSEIRYMRKRLRKFAKAKKVPTPLSQFPAKSYIQPTPYGNTLVMSPWNYPFLLTVDPVVDALAAGNTVVVKPSAYSPATSALLVELFEECFPEELVAVVTGGRRENAELLEKKFDLVFFTGSQTVGKEVLARMADKLTPVVLELGGKSPCIVDESAKLALAARRIVFGKFLNCGQTCVAPDYVLCHSSIKEKLVAEIIAQIKEQFGENPLENPDYGKIISEKHFDRLSGLIDPQKVLFGGGRVALKQKIEPTVVDATATDAVMQEEIFGPVLPVLTFDGFDEVYAFLKDKQKPLALYLFTENKKRAKEVSLRCAFGGGCINDTIMHLATSEMGFGGVGESGMGAYHGLAGFEAFSHKKSILNKRTWCDLPMRYQPYGEGKKKKVIRRFLK